jgi:hypothetical protein
MKKLFFSLLLMMAAGPSFAASNNQPNEDYGLMNVNEVTGRCPLLIASFVQYTKAQISMKLKGSSLDKSDSKQWLYTTAGYLPVGNSILNYDAISFEFNTKGTLKNVTFLCVSDTESDANENLKTFMASVVLNSNMFKMKDWDFYHKNGRGYLRMSPPEKESNGQYTWAVNFHYLK